MRSDDEVDVTGNTRLFCDRVAQNVARVVVLNPFQFEVIRKSVKKTDAHSARALVFFLSKDMLPEVRMKDQEHADSLNAAICAICIPANSWDRIQQVDKV